MKWLAPVLSIILLLYCLAGHFFPVMLNYQRYVGYLCLVIIIVSCSCYYYITIWSKPLVSVRTKVKKKECCSGWRGTPHYYVTFLLADRSELELSVSKLQYKSVERGIIVDLVYQGSIASSIKKDTDEVPIKYNDLLLKKRKK